MDDAAQTVPVTKEVRIVIIVGARHVSHEWHQNCEMEWNLEAINKIEEGDEATSGW